MSNMIAFKVSIMLGDGQVIENQIGAGNVFGAVKFVQDEVVKNGWFVASLLVQPLGESDVEDAVEVVQGKIQ